MKQLSKEQMMYLHSMAIKKTGGLDGIRDEGLLDSALNSPFQSFAGEELYPSIQSKAARLGFSIIKNHPFLDGNKRIGILAMMVFLDINGIEISCSDEDIIDIGLGVASGKYNAEYITEWIITFSDR
ncbi:type II toxin-antitoxin system death-on-curing family toxin [Clostridium beijerinckii]|jgi:death-on-curing protein|uniref:Type II toxin-antitoxin system death-on-curing family toxin n=1 Tax=Clostridium beijerinckii TaxID=1520 RepID=A0AAW3W5B4_CLOBE|nr:type II toxin-antitoxin system death-on-curing family toxin [Clostridium beijerinckii]MBC2456576.1 type II toxin-antitoxin system death-on-curing family toxin [Clostridium beijerinckii]MBC2473947.1 type II toxin-antitoxin system death-on-curing family toxin [Clostridium beijerinckii]MCI1478703.1 type II toxin-antitoxin system death-on-curing family toxin [Clostridium beijerinckii]MCI1579892.1 type II toxin-antitoxin system death-on-curing family toxin [Clostridium beijerinckii]MCI1582192.1 